MNLCCNSIRIQYNLLWRIGVSDRRSMLSGFPSVGEGEEGAPDNSDGEEEQLDTTKLVQEQNRKKKKSGGFQVIDITTFESVSNILLEI
jgi:hypothetical protein